MLLIFFSFVTFFLCSPVFLNNALLLLLTWLLFCTDINYYWLFHFLAIHLDMPFVALLTSLKKLIRDHHRRHHHVFFWDSASRYKIWCEDDDALGSSEICAKGINVLLFFTENVALASKLNRKKYVIYIVMLSIDENRFSSFLRLNGFEKNVSVRQYYMIFSHYIF